MEQITDSILLCAYSDDKHLSDKLSAHDKFLFFFWSLARYWGKIPSQNTASEQFQEQICTCAPSSIEHAIEDVF